MGELIEKFTKSGHLISTEGCLPSSLGFQVRRDNGKVTVKDGPFTEAKEVVGGFALVEVPDMDAAVELAKTWPGTGPIEGHDALLATFRGWAPSRPQVHLVSNTVLTSWTEQDAVAASDVVFVQRGESGWAVQVVAHYQDTFRCEDGAWRLRHRSTTYQT
jgi:hypothetical protein